MKRRTLVIESEHARSIASCHVRLRNLQSLDLVTSGRPNPHKPNDPPDVPQRLQAGLSILH